MNPLYRIPALILTASCHAVVAYHLLEHRYTKKNFLIFSILYSVCFVGLGACAHSSNGMAALFVYVGVVTSLFVFFCIVSRDAFPKKCFLYITYFGLWTAVDNIMNLTFSLFLPQISEVAEYYMVVVLRNVCLLLLLLLYEKYAAAMIRSLTVSGKNWWRLALIAVLFYVLQFVVYIWYRRHAMSYASLLLSFITITIVMCAVYGVIFSYIDYMNKDAESALIRQNAEYLSERLSVMQNEEATYRRFRHDMRHHLAAIAEYAKTGDTSAILSYIKEYDAEISETAGKQYSVNGTVNSILSAYAGKTRESGIAFSVRCNVPKELKVREIDLIALLGNLLENALHGCQKSGKENKSIEIYIRMQNSRLMILCNNTCPSHLRLSNGLPVGKSIGISSMLSVCQKYGGNLEYKIEEENCSACAVLHV